MDTRQSHPVKLLPKSAISKLTRHYALLVPTKGMKVLVKSVPKRFVVIVISFEIYTDRVL
jgi:hypothetical protein